MKASDVLSLNLDGFYNLATNVFMNKELSLKNMDKNKIVEEIYLV